MESNLEIPSIFEGIVQKLQRDLEEKKLAIIQEKLTSKDFDVDVKVESLKRFPKIAIAIDRFGAERVYYDDGTDEGFLVVTFVPASMAPGVSDIEQGKISIGLNYY